MMMKKLLFTTLSMSLLSSVAFGSDPNGAICEFAIKVYTTNINNNCFDGWPMKQIENFAGAILIMWKEKEYPQIIDEQDECTSLVTLTTEEYNSKSNVEKHAYQKSQERCGWNIGYDKTFAFNKDLGYRQGWDIEYTNKIDATSTNPDYEPIGRPSLLLAMDPSPLPSEIRYEGNLHWFATKYAEGWNEGTTKGLAEGKKEGKDAGKLAREVSDNYHFAYESGYKKGYNDATLNLSAMHDDPSNRNRQLRAGVERKMREQYSTGYSEGYDEAMEEKKRQEERSLTQSATRVCTRDCIKLHDGDKTLNTQQWEICKWVLPSCDSGRRLQQTGDAASASWGHVTTLPMDGIIGGEDFKTLVADVIDQKCQIADLTFEIWKSCPLTASSAPVI